VGLVVLLALALPCYLTLPWSMRQYDRQELTSEAILASPTVTQPMGSDQLGRPVVWRVLLGGAVSLTIGIAAASIAVGIGVTWGAMAGLAGGRVDSAMMRVVDVMYGLPYVLLVVLVDLALQALATRALGLDGRSLGVGLVTLLAAIGGVSWLTMARVVRGQVLSLREQPFVEAARAVGAGPRRVLRVHLLPNLAGVIVVYATLTVPLAILQESFLSFLGIGVRPPMPSWGNLAAEGVKELQLLTVSWRAVSWWLLLFPCLMLGLTLLSLNVLGDALRGRVAGR
jgi:oligopeptide transport system permease protein